MEEQEEEEVKALDRQLFFQRTGKCLMAFRVEAEVGIILQKAEEVHQQQY
jgi:hypothetical protein